MRQLPGVDNLGNYPAEIIQELEELLLSGGSASPDQKRNGFYDVENLERTFFIHISPFTGRVGLLATWLRPTTGCSEGCGTPIPEAFELMDQGPGVATS
jgi:hypothetical protein